MGKEREGAAEVEGETGRNKKATPFLPEEMPTSPSGPSARGAAGEGPPLPSPSLLTAGGPDLAWPKAEPDRPGAPGKGEAGEAAIRSSRTNVPASPNGDIFARNPLRTYAA